MLARARLQPFIPVQNVYFILLVCSVRRKPYLLANVSSYSIVGAFQRAITSLRIYNLARLVTRLWLQFG